MSEHDNHDSPETVEGPSTTLVYNRTESPRPDTLAILPMSETVLFP